MTPRTELRLIKNCIKISEALDIIQDKQRKLNQRRAENTTLALVHELQMIETVKCNKILENINATNRTIL